MFAPSEHPLPEPAVQRPHTKNLFVWGPELASIWDYLERLVRTKFRNFPRLHRWVEVEDVVQAVSLRLLRTVQATTLESVEDPAGLAAALVWHELLDLKRHFCGPTGPDRHEAKQLSDDTWQLLRCCLTDSADNTRELDQWTSFHRSVRMLPAEEHEVFRLIFYDGQSQTEAADLLRVSVRTVQRRWQSALARLRRLLRLEEEG